MARSSHRMPTPATKPSSLIKPVFDIISIKKATAVVRAPSKMPEPLLRMLPLTAWMNPCPSSLSCIKVVKRWMA